ncbi:MAG: aminotransferase class I/II-fold pyridoxal phosphate-dependent enzyme [Sneathiellaceae bacterium]
MAGDGRGEAPRGNMVLRPSRRAAIAPFRAMEVLKAANARERAGHSILHLETGQPGTGAPAPVRAEAARLAQQATLGYTDALGIPALRAAIAGHYARWYGIDLAPERVVVTTGSSGAFLLAFLALFDRDARIGLAVPGYPAYRNILAALDMVEAALPVDGSSRFQPTPAHLARVAGRLDGLLVANPANPTGSMLGAADLQALAEACAARGTALIVDEIYHGICYAWPAPTILSLRDDAVVVNSFSKYFGMTGWRLGWMVVPENLCDTVERLAQNLFISPPAIAQYAALAAFEAYDELDANVARYARNRQILLDALPGLGMGRFAPPDGAFYLYVDVSDLTADSASFGRQMLEETGIAATPGIDFDPEAGHRFLRFSFAGTGEDIAEAVVRLRRWLPDRRL